MTESRIYALRSMQNVHSTWQDGDDLHRWRRPRREEGANRNDAGTLTSNKLNGGPRGASVHPAATQSNIVSTPDGRGRTKREGLLEDGRAGGGKYYPVGPISSARGGGGGRVSVISACKSTSYFRSRLAIYARNILEIQRRRCDRIALSAFSV